MPGDMFWQVSARVRGVSQALREHFPQGDREQEGPEWLEVRAGRSDGDEGLQQRRCGLCSDGPLPREGAAGSKWVQV